MNFGVNFEKALIETSDAEISVAHTKQWRKRWLKKLLAVAFAEM